MISLHSNGQVRMRKDICLPVSMEQAWHVVSQVESFACIDFFHRRIRSLERPGEPPGRILIDHRFLGVQITREGKIYGWREGSGYRFTDLSRRDRRSGFPHVYRFSLRREGTDRCSLRIEINGRWTTGWMPRLLVIFWLRLIFTKIATSAEQIILMDACKMIWQGRASKLGLRDFHHGLLYLWRRCVYLFS